jgi:hypothetical protein
MLEIECCAGEEKGLGDFLLTDHMINGGLNPEG